MTKEQKFVKDWMEAFGQACPEKPVVPCHAIRCLRAKLVLEEAVETITALGLRILLPDDEAKEVYFDEVQPFIAFMKHGEPNLVEVADGCEDLKVVTEGTLIACGLTQNLNRFPAFETPEINTDPLFTEVMRSNFSKIWSFVDISSMSAEFWDSHTWIAIDENHYRVLNSDGKVIKSPSYSPADLKPIIDSFSKWSFARLSKS